MTGVDTPISGYLLGYETAHFRGALQLKHTMTRKPVPRSLPLAESVERAVATAHRYRVGPGSPRFSSQRGQELGLMKMLLAESELTPEVSQETPLSHVDTKL